MGEVIRGVDSPLVACPVVVVLFDDAIGWQIPHLRIALVRIGQALFHAQECLSSLVFAITHSSEFGDGLFDWPGSMFTGVPLASIVGASTLHIDLLS